MADTTDKEKLKLAILLCIEWDKRAERLKQEYYFPDYSHWVDETVRERYNTIVRLSNEIYELLK